MNLFMKWNRLADIQNRLVVDKGEEVGGGMDWEFGISRCKLLHIEWINKILLNSTGNYIQYPVINHHGKEYEKEFIHIYTYIYIWLLFCTAEIGTTLLISYTSVKNIMATDTQRVQTVQFHLHKVFFFVVVVVF